MSRIDDLWATFKDASNEAQGYFMSCTHICNAIASAIYKDFGLVGQHSDTHLDQPNKQVILILNCPIPDKIKNKTVDIKLIVSKKGKEFNVKLEKTGDEFPLTGMETVSEQYKPIADAVFKYLESVATANAWQGK